MFVFSYIFTRSGLLPPGSPGHNSLVIGNTVSDFQSMNSVYKQDIHLVNFPPWVPRRPAPWLLFAYNDSFFMFFVVP